MSFRCVRYFSIMLFMAISCLSFSENQSEMKQLSNDRSPIKDHFKNKETLLPTWKILLRTPNLPKPDESGLANINGIKMWYATYGEGDPVLLVHESYGNANYWGLLIPLLAKHFKVVVMDMRNHGRTNRDKRELSYQLMADDVVQLMDYLKLERSSLIGWGDGANVGLIIAMQSPERLNRLYAFSGNIKPADDVNEVFASDVFMQYVNRCAKEYLELSPTPTKEAFENLNQQLRAMWSKEPNFSIEQIKTIKAFTLVSSGDHDGAISFSSDTITLASNIKNAGLLIQPFVSHFAILERPKEFNESVLNFLLMRSF